MSDYKFERLSAQDNSFLIAEHENVPLHVSAVSIFELGDLVTADGGVDIRKLKRATEAQLHKIPRYRQKLAWVPIENRPVWVDDPHFNIDYHIRHAALPKPGGLEQLKQLAARITSHPLDRSRPMWEIWVVEGLEGDRFAMVSKIHHCMIDGAAGANVAQILFSHSKDYELEEPVPFIPRPKPGRDELLRDAVVRGVSLPLRALRGLFSVEPGDLREMGGELATRARALGDLASTAIHPSSSTPLNGPLGPHRRIDWLTLPLDDVRNLKHQLGCTINDLVLATVTGAVRQYLMLRGMDPAQVDFRVSAPVSIRAESDKAKLGNHVSTWIVPLPIGESKPQDWVEKIHEVTTALKESQQALAFEMIMSAAEYLPPSVFALAARSASGPINMIVTNVPGPQFPLYLLGARLLELHPIVPLLDGLGLGIALFSYDGKLHVGLNAEYELVPDLGAFTALFAQSYLALLDAAPGGAKVAGEGEEPAAELEPASGPVLVSAG